MKGEREFQSGPSNTILNGPNGLLGHHVVSKNFSLAFTCPKQLMESDQFLRKFPFLDTSIGKLYQYSLNLHLCITFIPLILNVPPFRWKLYPIDTQGRSFFINQEQQKGIDRDFTLTANMLVGGVSTGRIGSGLLPTRHPNRPLCVCKMSIRFAPRPVLKTAANRVLRISIGFCTG